MVIELENTNSILFNGHDVQKVIFNGVEVWTKGGYIDYSTLPLTFEFISSGTIYWKSKGSGGEKTISYSINDGSWNSITADTTGVGISVSSGDKIRFKGNNLYYNNGDTSSHAYRNNYSFFDIPKDVECNVYGNIMSLINGTDFVGTGLSSDNIAAFVQIFKPSNTTDGSGIVDASNLILPDGNVIGCFRAMFAGCKKMTKAPKEVYILNVSGATHKCYYMFENCISLTTAPTLPSFTVSNYDYQYMFTGCTSLTSCTCLLDYPSFGSSGGRCYNMFRNITTSGTLTASSRASGRWTQGANGVPTTWSITYLT